MISSDEEEKKHKICRMEIKNIECARVANSTIIGERWREERESEVIREDKMWRIQHIVKIWFATCL